MVCRGDIPHIAQRFLSGQTKRPVLSDLIRLWGVCMSLPHVLGIILGVDRRFETRFRTVQQFFEQKPRTNEMASAL